MMILWCFVRLKMMVPWIRSESVLLGLLEPSSLQWAGRKYFLVWLGLDIHGLITCDCFPSRLEDSLNSKLARSTMITPLWSITLLQKLSHSFWFYVFLDNDDLCLIPGLSWLLLILHFSCLLAICLIIPMSVIRSCTLYAMVPYRYHLCSLVVNLCFTSSLSCLKLSFKLKRYFSSLPRCSSFASTFFSDFFSDSVNLLFFCSNCTFLCLCLHLSYHCSQLELWG